MNGNFSGHGLTSMLQRAEALGGTLALDSVPGTGTRVTLKVKVTSPWRAATHCLASTRRQRARQAWRSQSVAARHWEVTFTFSVTRVQCRGPNRAPASHPEPLRAAACCETVAAEVPVHGKSRVPSSAMSNSKMPFCSPSRISPAPQRRAGGICANLLEDQKDLPLDSSDHARRALPQTSTPAPRAWCRSLAELGDKIPAASADGLMNQTRARIESRFSRATRLISARSHCASPG